MRGLYKECIRIVMGFIRILLALCLDFIRILTGFDFGCYSDAITVLLGFYYDFVRIVIRS